MTERGVRNVYSAVGLSANRTPSARGKFTVGCLYESHSCRGVKNASETPPRTLDRQLCFCADSSMVSTGFDGSRATKFPRALSLHSQPFEAEILAPRLLHAILAFGLS
ncbi:conserved hypothetical protein [Coccidioides posadasii str. Silveira]|uniref:Uncharacterized protein n=2 Tax=Coccidioides posadasii TaxID=199306 RepID=E9D9V9_COCPS|nr:conserved hypothetical protein [Coccidioides posadasii str. Silveira]KMM64545.1 hypothetical protein CPAG_00897 [Coccidioides posadasii RMSCC 3488]